MALGLQIILFHNLREGLPMMWSVPMRADEHSDTVDILAQMKHSISNADRSTH